MTSATTPAATRTEMMNAMMVPAPRALAMTPPTTAPAIPIRTVRTTPMGLRPGTTRRASAPMIGPMIMNQTIVISISQTTLLPDGFRRLGFAVCMPPGGGLIQKSLKTSEGAEADASRLRLADLHIGELRRGDG